MKSLGMESVATGSEKTPEVVPLGDSALLVRFGTDLDPTANLRAIAMADALEREPIDGVLEVVPSLVSVLVRYQPEAIDHWRLRGEIGVKINSLSQVVEGVLHRLPMRFDGPDLQEVADLVDMDVPTFIAAHNQTPLRILTTGFAPGFVYCGFHNGALVVPRRTALRAKVAVGSVLFAAGQTAIAATEIPTGWHVIGHTTFQNFDPSANPPTVLRAGERIQFEVVS